MAGIGRDDGPEGKDPAITRARRPGLARWSIPLIPYMSPAAIGCSVVSPRGWPALSNRSPMARSTRSGQPSPLEELTVTTASSGISAAASSAVMKRAMVPFTFPP